MTQAEYLNLDKEAATQALQIVGNVFIQAGKEAEEKGTKEGKSGPELEKMKRDIQQKRIETLERLVTKTLGVLQEQGVYAMMLFLFSRSSDEYKVSPCIRAQLFEAIEKLPKFKNDRNVPKENSDAKEALQFYINNILGDLDTLFLVRDLYEQTLIYARYAAKAEQRGD